MIYIVLYVLIDVRIQYLLKFWSKKWTKVQLLHTCADNEEYIFGIPSFSTAGVHGFSVSFTNGISSVKYEYDTKEPAVETIELLDSAPDGTGEWTQVQVAKWDAQFVSGQKKDKRLQECKKKLYLHVIALFIGILQLYTKNQVIWFYRQ